MVTRRVPTRWSLIARRASVACGGLVMLVGAADLFAWYTGLASRLGPTAIVMKTNTGAGLIACGLALLLLAGPPPGPVRRRAAALCAVFVLLLGAVTLSEHLFGWDAGIDQLLASEPPGAAATASPNRMGPPASLSLTLIGGALLLLARGRRARRLRAPHEPLALAVGAIALVSLVGFLYDATELYGHSRVSGIAWPTALSLAVLALGVLCARSDAGLMARATADNQGGVMIRTLFGPTVGLPIVLGWIRLAGEHRGWVGAELGTALVMVTLVITSGSILLAVGWRIARASTALQASERRARTHEERFRVTLTSIGDGVIVTDAARVVRLLNREAERLTGWTDAQARGRPLAEVFTVVDERTGEPVPDPVEQALQRETVVGLDRNAALVARDGRRFPIDDTAAPIRREGGRVQGAALVFRDVSEARHAEASLERERNLLASIMRVTDAMLVYLDNDFNFVWVNAAYASTCRMTPQEMVGRNHFALYPDPENEAIFRRVRDTGEPVFHKDKAFTFPDQPERGTTYWDWSLVPARNASGAVVGLVFSLRETTQVKLAEQALEQANRDLAEADRHKNDFLTVLSHELRNPLAPIRAAVALLDQAPAGGAVVARARGVIERQMTQITGLVDDLLDVTRISRGKIELRREPLDLAALAARIAEDHRPLFAARGIEIEVALDAPSLPVNGDVRRLSQAIGNLLQNAAKFAGRGGRTTITAGTPDGVMAAVSVRDTGAGISAEALPHVFEAFVQAGAEPGETRGGLGLGLAVVKGLVELHGGSVRAYSEGSGRGAEFTLQIPLDHSPAAVPVPKAGSRVATRRILLVEDSADAAETLREALALRGHAVEVAHSGEDALVSARRFRPDVMLCDIGLPGMTGYDLARAVRTDESLQSIFLVALTGYAAPEDLARTRDAGFDRHVVKPPSLGQLDELLAASPPNPFPSVGPPRQL